MARLPELCEAFAAVDDRDLPAIRNIARVVREADLISTTKRGVGAAEMTTRDAANLMMALDGSEAAKDAVRAVERLRAMQPRPPVAATSASLQEPYRSIAAAGSFGEALEITIESVPTLLRRFAEDITKAGGEVLEPFLDILLRGEGLAYDQLVVTFSKTTATIERIAFRFESGQFRKKTPFRQFFIVDDVGFRGLADYRTSDRAVSVKIGLPTIISVWRALHGEAEYSQACSAARASLSLRTEVNA